jgi:hypothetical protein
VLLAGLFTLAEGRIMHWHESHRTAAGHASA